MRKILPITVLANIVFSVVELLLSLRIILKLFGANSAAPFVTWIYATTNSLLTPFVGIFPNPSLRDGFVLEMSSLFALLVYGFLAYLIDELINYIEIKATKTKEH